MSPSKNKNVFYLARHGETEWNRIKRLQGRLDSPLTEQGIQQANDLAASMTNYSVDAVITSPLLRARRTAEICQQQLNCPILVNDLLQERHFGDWQQQLFDDLTNLPDFENIFFRVTDHCPPNGESALQGAKRLQQALTDLAQQFTKQQLLIITHGDLLRSFLAQFNRDAFCDAYSQYGNGRFFKVEYSAATQLFSLSNN
ncbi:histidine phosphatase family protein [Pleionea mediterranea]|uniref:Putative phosphoglycerate mutase n=1 Tax=Pleionea mediterranea TaxID=523701 RepID=A0A316FDZ5_9GAMM|nr:histidine phosphatase family protein [Pleionea mediterranea]PWK46355.1 putative phosphoglycerate mutase [Pleionea mediterranea]